MRTVWLSDDCRPVMAQYPYGPDDPEDMDIEIDEDYREDPCWQEDDYYPEYDEPPYDEDYYA